MSKKNSKKTDRPELYGMVYEPTYSGATTFLRRAASQDLNGVDLAITGIPLDTATTNRPGARFGPRAVRLASTIMAWEKPYGLDFNPVDRLAMVDYGDCHFDFGKPEAAVNEMIDHISSIIDQGPGVLTIGGDHFVTYPVLKAYAKKYKEPISLIHFDAHTDTWEAGEGQDPEEENGRIDHGTMFYHAVKEGIVDPKNSVQIGIRTENPDTMGFNILDAPWVHKNGIEQVIKKTLEIVGNKPVYMTFDIDCLDPSFAPGTGTPVCGGLTSHQAMSIIRGLSGINLIGMDVVEVAPAYDVGEITALAAAHIAMEMVAIYASKPEFK
jgi:agmatinase